MPALSMARRPHYALTSAVLPLSASALLAGVLAALLVPRRVRGAARGPSPRPSTVLADDSA